MRISLHGKTGSGRRRAQRGAAMLVVLGLLAIMAILVVSNSHVLYALDQDLKLVEKKQLKRIEAVSGQTSAANDPAGSNP